MVVELSTAFTMRCPGCGRLEINQLNIFQLSGSKEKQIYCECGTRKASFRRKGSGHIIINYHCILCDLFHSVVVDRRKFWSKNRLNYIYCLDTELNLGYFGSYRKIKREIDRQQEELDSMADELGFDDFVDPELMLDILDFLHDTSASGYLYCECGSQDINIDLFSDRIELTCNDCRASLTIPATGRKDLDNLRIQDEVVVTSKNCKGPWINI